MQGRARRQAGGPQAEDRQRRGEGAPQGLPASLTSLLASAPCRSVLLALADADTTTRQELLRQLKGELAAVLELEGGRTFVEEIIKD